MKNQEEQETQKKKRYLSIRLWIGGLKSCLEDK